MKRRIPFVFAALLVACTSSPPAPDVSRTPEARLLASREPTRCRDAAPPITGAAAVVDQDASRVPGRALFNSDRKLQLLESGRTQELTTPFPAQPRSSKVARDRVVALLGGTRPGEAHLWERNSAGIERLVRMPAPLGADDAVNWSPELSRAAWGSWAGREVWVVGLAGHVHRAAFTGEAAFSLSWRSEDEVTVVTAPATTSGWPLENATLWSWRPPADPLRLAGPLTLVTGPRWSPDGRVLATLEGPVGGRSIVLRGDTTRSVVSDHDLMSGPNDCGRDLPDLTGLQWSPDGTTLAVHGRGIGYFVAFIDVQRSVVTGLFVSPVGPATCYIPGTLAWSGSTAVVPLFGPDCGPSAKGQENALALIDARTGKFQKYVLIPRKGFIGLSGDWAVTGSALDERSTEFVPLTDGLARIRVPLWRVADYCCAK